ncbi:transglutaminase domain-containing protein [Paenibacillus sp. PL2-23]|uniref:transglutaminase TgpA family protein n=1 Tax=Paenibacillus sp. PL2-23 TaxID=2100729 RepID=UPI0030F7B62C
MRKRAKSLLNLAGKHWYDRSVSVFVALIIISSLSIFEGYWWPETYAIAYGTLVWAAIIDIFIPYKLKFFRWTLQFAAAVVLTFRHARMEWAVAPPERAGDVGWWLQQTLAGLHPFIWFGLLLWFIHALFAAWAKTRLRMFGFVGASILLLTVADSFTPIWLWDNVAAVVFVGLIWLVLDHLHSLKRKHPDSWRDLLEYPIRVFTPAAIVLAIFLAIALNVPSIAPLLQDPYTIWKNAKGEEVRVFLGDKAIVNDSSSGSSSNASSGYSRNDEELGGGFDYDFSPMMTVQTSQKSYWRGEDKSVYTGKGWEDEATPFPLERVLKEQELAVLFPPELAEVTEVSQIITMEREDVYPVLFGASSISKVNWVGEKEQGLPRALSWLPVSAELRWSGGESPQAYSITSSVVMLDEEGLRGVEAKLPDAGLQAMYVQLPDSVTQRVRDLAAEVTAAGATDYDKAKLLEQFLRTSYAYDNKPDLTKLTGSSGDFVDQFLFELMEGYCDYFSTSMAVMARTLELPARWVKGFSPGSLPAEYYGPPEELLLEEDLNPAGAGMYTVRNADAHSWVEIYFDGYGWIPFEPTSGFLFPYAAAEGEEPAAPETEADEPEASPAEPERADSGSGIWKWLGLAAILAAAAAVLIGRKRIAMAWRSWRNQSYSANELIVLETNRLLRACRKRGLQREEHETMREAVARWTDSRKRLRDDFRYVLDRFEQAKYGAGAATKDEADRFASKVRELIGELR